MQCSIFVKISLTRFTSKHGWRKRSYCWILFAPKTTDRKNFGSWRKLNRSDFINSRIYDMEGSYVILIILNFNYMHTTGWASTFKAKEITHIHESIL